MVKNLWVVLILFIACTANATDSTKAKLYDLTANAAKDILNAVAKAKATNKHVLVQAGGNWCSWCLRFNKFTTEESQLDSMIKENFIVLSPKLES